VDNGVHTNNNVSLARFLFNDIRVVEVGDYNSNIEVLLLELIAFVLGAD
jgi:hypothetical protein